MFFTLLFVLLINDISYILLKLSEVPDDTKQRSAVGDGPDVDIVRRRFRWLKNWHLLFSQEKCSVMRV